MTGDTAVRLEPELKMPPEMAGGSILQSVASCVDDMDLEKLQYAA